MNFENQLIFFFSALGAFNGLLLAFYFAFIANKNKFSNNFLALLLLTLSIRTVKSVFFYFNPQLSGIFIQIGLSACVLIGPFLYLYIKSYTIKKTSQWKVHTLPILIIIIALGIVYPYVEHRTIWSRYILKIIYLQWLVYILLSFKYIRPIFAKVFQKDKKLTNINLWLLSIFSGTSIIWLSYNIGAYNSHIAGASSFSFVFYLIILLFIFRNKKNISFFEKKEKYEDKVINKETVERIIENIDIIKEKKLFKNPNLKLPDVAKQLNIPPYQLSQLLNDNLGKSFSLFINEFRIEEAKKLLISGNTYTIEAIGYDCGFNSKSTFFTTFKKITGTTPAKYRKEKAQEEAN